MGWHTRLLKKIFTQGRHGFLAWSGYMCRLRSALSFIEIEVHKSENRVDHEHVQYRAGELLARSHRHVSSRLVSSSKTEWNGKMLASDGDLISFGTSDRDDATS